MTTTVCPREVPPATLKCPNGCGYTVYDAPSARWRLHVHLHCKPSTCHKAR